MLFPERKTLIIKSKTLLIRITFNEKFGPTCCGDLVDASQVTSKKKSIWQRWGLLASDLYISMKALHHRLLRLHLTQVAILVDSDVTGLKSGKMRVKIFRHTNSCSLRSKWYNCYNTFLTFDVDLRVKYK